MIYIVLIGLLILGLRMLFYLKRCERDISQRSGRELLCVMFFAYLAWIFYQMMQMQKIEGFKGLLIVLWYIPFGIFMPLLFRRFRYLLLNLMLAGVYSGLCFLIQLLRGQPVHAVIILFSVFGTLLGFVLCKMIRMVVPELRKGYFIEKKRISSTLKLEAEIMGISMLLGIAIISIGMQVAQSFKETPEVAKDVLQKEQSKYEKIAFANENHYERYYLYQQKNPNLDIETVVWHVEANLDQEFYDKKYVSYVDKNWADPLLINKYNRVSDDFEPQELVPIEGEYVATPETAKAYKKMIADLEEEGMKIYVTSSYRSVEYQQNLYNRYLKTDTKAVVDTYSARPGHSEHHTGRALDVSQVYNNLDAFEGSDEAQWVYENAYKYGFIVRYTEDNIDVTGYMYEPWHITYVGQEISQRMHDEKIETLEEYVVKYGQ